MFQTGLQSASEDKSYQRSAEQRKKTRSHKSSTLYCSELSVSF